jgi:hypothetical protein
MHICGNIVPRCGWILVRYDQVEPQRGILSANSTSLKALTTVYSQKTFQTKPKADSPRHFSTPIHSLINLRRHQLSFLSEPSLPDTQILPKYPYQPPLSLSVFLPPTPQNTALLTSLLPTRNLRNPPTTAPEPPRNHQAPEYPTVSALTPPPQYRWGLLVEGT